MEVRDLRLMADLGNVANIPFDPRDRESMREAIRGADIVINLIGKHYQTKHLLPWWINFTYDDVHVDVARTIAELAAEERVPRLIHHSSILAKPNSPSMWAASKFRGERAVRLAFPNATIVRSAPMYGPDDRLLIWMAERAKRAGVPLVNNGDAVVQPVFVNNVAAAIYAISQDRTINGEVFELVGDDAYSYKELADFVFETTTLEPRLINLPLWLAIRLGKIREWFPEPIFTSDAALCMSLPQVKTSHLPGLRELDIEPSKMEAEAPNFLVRFNRGGHFQQVEGYH